MHEYLDPRVIKEPKATAEIWTPKQEKCKVFSWVVLLPNGEEDRVSSHNLTHEHGALVFTEKHDDVWIVVNIYAPGTWAYVSLHEI